MSQCKCNCGYRCGGPGRCKDQDCLTKTEGHYVRDCSHKWDGPFVEGSVFGCYVTSVTCSVCGMLCADHDAKCGP